MAEEIDELKKLSPEERLKKLKELEEKRKKEIEAAQAMIQNTEAEIEDEAKERDMIPIPQLRSDSLESLQTEEEKQLFATKRYLSRRSSEEKEEKIEDTPVTLEDTVFSEAARLTPSEIAERRELQHNLAKEMTAKQMYNRMTDISKQEQESGYTSAAQQQEKQNLVYAAQYKSQDISSGSYRAPTKEAERQLSSIFSKYKH